MAGIDLCRFQCVAVVIATQVVYHKADKEDIHTFNLDKATLNHIRLRFPFLQDGDNFTLRHK